MLITLATLADFCSVSVGDKLNILGVFDTIYAEKFPHHHAHMFLAARLQFEFEDQGRDYSIEIYLEDEDGGRPFRAPPVKVSVKNMRPGAFPSRNIVLELVNTAFAGPGTYRFIFKCGDKTTAVPFKVIERQ